MKIYLINRIIIIFLAIAVMVLGFKSTELQNKLTSNESETAEVSSLLAGGDAALGYSCGALSSQLAKQLTGSNVDLRRDFEQGPADTIQATKTKQESIFWSDNCRYEDVLNSNRYIEMYVATFKSNEAALKAFPDFIQIVNEVEEITDQDYGQQLLYDGGVFYLLKDNKVIQTSASNGFPQETEFFSRKVFETIVTSL